MNRSLDRDAHTVLIIGGGYAGVLAANRIAGRAAGKLRVVLVSEGSEFVHRVRLHEVAAGRATRRYLLTELVRREVEIVQGRVTRINVAGRVCGVQRDGVESEVRYDMLVYSVGSGATREVGEARQLVGYEAAIAIAGELNSLRPGESVVVVGGGLCGIEIAGEVAEAHRGLRVTLVGPALAPSLAPNARRAIFEGLSELGVTIREGNRVHRAVSGSVVLDGGERLESSLTIWAAGFSVSSLARESGLPVDENGRLLVDETLRVLGHPEIFGCGDAAVAPASCNGTGASTAILSATTAMPMGAHVADAILDIVRGRVLRPFRFAYMGWCVSIGRARGVAYLVNADNEPTGRVFKGILGMMQKRMLEDYGPIWLRIERWLPGTYFWPGRFARPRARRFAAAKVSGALTGPEREAS